MAVFERVTLGWRGDEYIVEPNRVMMMLAEIEHIITFAELAANPKKPPLVRISMAYGAALRFAGAKVQDEEIYSAMFKDNNAAETQEVIGTLMAMMIPPEHLRHQGSDDSGESEGKPEADSDS